MSVLNTLPAPVIQMGLVEKIVEHQQNHPQVQQHAAQEEVAALIARDSRRINETEKSEHGRRVKEREAGQGRKQRREAREKEEENAILEAEQEESPPSQSNPWAGHLVNVKI